MKFKLIPRQKSNCTIRDILDILSLFLKGKLRRGSYIKEFEELISKFHSQRYALATGSCRLAFYLILKALNIYKNDEVIIPAYNMSAFPKVLKLNGIKPKFVDIDEWTLNIDVNKIEKNINERTRAIVAVHLFGNPCDMDGIMNIARKYSLPVIEDCANSIGGKYKGKLLGTFGDAVCFSFGHSKDISTLGGGMVLTNDEKLYMKIKELYDDEFVLPDMFEITKIIIKNIILKLATARIIFCLFVYPFIMFANFVNSNILNNIFEEKDELSKMVKKRYANFQARIGINHFEAMNRLQNKRIANAQTYNKLLVDIKGIRIPKSVEGAEHVYWQYPIWVRDREKIIKKLLKKGIDTKKIYTYDCNNYIIFKKFSSHCPISEQTSEKILCLPVYHYLKEKDIVFISELLKYYYCYK